jgi:nucleotide-binding universal stress UspA family protein
MIRRILLAVDAENDSRQAESLAAELGKRLGAEVTVLHVREWLLGPSGPFDEGARRTMSLIQEVSERLQAKGLHVQHEIRSTYFAFTARRIVEVAQVQAADLIVLGSHRRARSIRNILRRDVTTEVLRDAAAPVLVAA